MYHVLKIDERIVDADDGEPDVSDERIALKRSSPLGQLTQQRPRRRGE
jgi:hypothetical protein